jgi:predicted nucleic acid-binding protein
MAVNKISVGSGQIGNLPDKLYLDTSFLVAAFLKFDKFHHQASSLLLALQFQPTTCLISTLALDESWWAILQAKYKSDKLRGRISDSRAPDKLTARWLKSNKSFISNSSRELRQFRVFIDQRVRKGRFKLIGVEADRAPRAFDNMLNVPIPPRDAFHLSVIEGEGIPAVATADDDYDNAPFPNFTVFSVK